MSNMEGGPCAASLRVPPRLALSWSMAFRRKPSPGDAVWAAAGLTPISASGVGMPGGPYIIARTRATSPTRPKIPDSPESHRRMSHLQPWVMGLIAPSKWRRQSCGRLGGLDGLGFLVDREVAAADRALVLVDRPRVG